MLKFLSEIALFLALVAIIIGCCFISDEYVNSRNDVDE